MVTMEGSEPMKSDIPGYDCTSIEGLRRLWPEWEFEGGHVSGRAGPEFVDPGDWHIQRSTYSSGYWYYWAKHRFDSIVKARGNTEAEAARALAAALVAAGYEPREKNSG